LAVSYVGGSPEDAQRQLAEYIQQTDEKVAKELELDLVDNIKLQTTTLQDSLKTQEVVAQEQKICESSKSRKRCGMQNRRGD
jgi:chain length determinant protein (polysaccharide antigen chain regulator)